MKRIVPLVLFFVLFAATGYGGAEAEEGKYVIKISIGKCRLQLLERQTDGSMVTVREYRAGTTKIGLKQFPLGEGTVTKIEFNPTWHPTAYTRSYLAKKGQIIPESVPPGDPLNYMGSVRISLSHDVPGKGKIYRIHGVRAGDEDTVGRRISGGCTRMINAEGEELARLVSVGTKVIIEL